MDLREIPGAETPWAEINKLLEPAERLTWKRGTDEGFLLAPKDKSRLAAAVFHCRERDLPIQVSGTGTLSSSSWHPGHSSAVISGRHLVHMDLVGEDQIQVGAGVLLLKARFEKWREVTLCIFSRW